MKKKIEVLLLILLLGLSIPCVADVPPTDDPVMDDDMPPTDDPPLGAPINEGTAVLVIAGLAFAGKMYHNKNKNRCTTNKMSNLN